MTEQWTYRANRNGRRRVHVFLPGDRHSWCGFRLDTETDEALEENFLSARRCNACRRNATSDMSAACKKCGITHLSLSRISHKGRVGYLRRRDGDDCTLCGLTIIFADGLPAHLRASADHIVERRNGGCSHPKNMRLTHMFCNAVRERWPDPTTHPAFVTLVPAAMERAICA